MNHSAISFDRLECFILIEPLIFCSCHSFLKTVTSRRNYVLANLFPFVEVRRDDITFLESAWIARPNLPRTETVIAALNGYCRTWTKK